MTPDLPSAARELPMFPLGSVLLPTMLLPLHIFEDRYRALVRAVLDSDQRFGVVMIERGSEVGGSDVRSSIGCEAQILEAEEQDDGRWFIVAVGTSVIEVTEWLADEPYPRAMVRDRPDADGGDPAAAASMDDDPRWLELDSAFRTLLDRSVVQMNSPVPRDIALSDVPAVATMQMAAVAPLATFDRYRVLSADTADRRRALLLEAFEDATLVIDGGDLPD